MTFYLTEFQKTKKQQASSQTERFKYFHALVGIIGGETGMSAYIENLTEDMMVTMPLHNYVDKPRSSIELWCRFFESMSIESKTELLVKIWNCLDGKEQTLVIVDLREFISTAAEEKTLAEIQAVRLTNDDDTVADIE